MEISVDTSAVMAVILNEPSKAKLLATTHGGDLQSAPALPWEIGNGLSALFKRGRIDLDQARRAWDSFEGIPIRLARVDMTAALAIADDYGIYAYDAYVLECALRYRTPLLSLDRAQCEVAAALGLDVVEVTA